MNIHRPGSIFPQQAGAKQILSSNEYADAVRERERFCQAHGILAVPAVIVNDRHLIQGGQPAEVFEKALLRQKLLEIASAVVPGEFNEHAQTQGIR